MWKKCGCKGCYYNRDMEEDIKLIEDFLLGKKMQYGNGYTFFKQFNAIENLLKRYKELEELNKGLIESNKEWLKHYSILETESEILKAENEQYKKQFEDIKNNILVPSITEKNFIPISVIQNKIDEMDKIINSSENKNHIHTKIEASIVKGELQELLEERNK